MCVIILIFTNGITQCFSLFPEVTFGNPLLTSLRIASDYNPDFSKPIGNVTAPVGREAVLTCAVTNLGPYKVGVLK